MSLYILYHTPPTKVGLGNLRTRYYDKLLDCCIQYKACKHTHIRRLANTHDQDLQSHTRAHVKTCNHTHTLEKPSQIHSHDMTTKTCTTKTCTTRMIADLPLWLAGVYALSVLFSAVACCTTSCTLCARSGTRWTWRG